MQRDRWAVYQRTSKTSPFARAYQVTKTSTRTPLGLFDVSPQSSILFWSNSKNNYLGCTKIKEFACNVAGVGSVWTTIASGVAVSFVGFYALSRVAC